MKKVSILLLLAVAQFSAYAQFPVSTLSENFNVACLTSSGMASGWIVYNPVAATRPDGEWTCAPGQGRGTGSSCVTATGTYGSSFNLDTSYLLTPTLFLGGYGVNHAYLNFDTKVTDLTAGGDTLSVELTYDTTAGSAYTDPFIYVPDTLSPVIGVGDASGWVTHRVDLYGFQTSGAFRIAFRYTSNTTAGNEWFLDNVNIVSSLQSINADKQTIPVTVIGASTPDKITLNYSSVTTGVGHLALYDMMGREVYKENIVFDGTTTNHTISGLGLAPGMYVIKIGNDDAYNVAKVMVQ